MKKDIWSWVCSALIALAYLAGLGVVLLLLILLFSRYPGAVIVLLVALTGTPLVLLVHDCPEDFIPKWWRKKK